VFADGIGIRVVGKMMGQRIRQNVNGTDLLPLLCAHSENSTLGLFLLGARPGIAEAVARWIEETYPGTKPRAPQWVRELSLEWAFRLFQEPGRIWKRYLFGNFIFLWRVCISRLIRGNCHNVHLGSRGL
jgi:UDP-N-acetyl-D-mannosaminuronic acid transferase (WecB/TagA/CpsF family)